MTREERKLLKHMQEHAGGPERRKALKKAAKLHRAARFKTPRRRFDLRTLDGEDWDEVEVPALEKWGRRKPEPTPVEGLVAGIGPGFCQVSSALGPLGCKMVPGIAVGDRVLVAGRGRRFEITEILPRRTALSRPDPHNPRLERVIAANIDAAVIVASVRAPALRPGLIDRYLIAIERSGAEPILCVNKMDLLESDGELAALEPYCSLSLRVIRCAAATGQGVDALLEALAGKLCVLVGHSGVGKSSLLNAMQPELALETSAVSEGTQKGRHTTSASRLYELTGGARIIDTPGVREFGLWDLGRHDLSVYFHEFDPFASSCGFSDCTHTHEPDCGVKQAVASGVIRAARYQAYCRIRATVP